MDSCGGQLVCDLLVGITLQKQLEHISDTLRFFGDNNISLQFLIILIAENVLVCSTDQAFLKAFSDIYRVHNTTAPYAADCVIRNTNYVADEVPDAFCLRDTNFFGTILA